MPWGFSFEQGGFVFVVTATFVLKLRERSKLSFEIHSFIHFYDELFAQYRKKKKKKTGSITVKVLGNVTYNGLVRNVRRSSQL